MEFRNVWSWRQEAGLANPVYCTALQLHADIQTATFKILTAAYCWAADVLNDCVAVLFKDKQPICPQTRRHMPEVSNAPEMQIGARSFWSLSDSRVVCV